MQKPNNKSLITDNRSLDRVFLLLATFSLAACSGYLSGRLITDNKSLITLYPDVRLPVPTVHIQGVRNGLLHGSIKGSARVIIGKEVFTQSGVFALNAGPLLVNERTIVIPDYAQFVASKRGKKYYSVLSAAGSKIAPKNRIYFSQESDALKAGYVP